jgi:diacylglycerol kinase
MVRFFRSLRFAWQGLTWAVQTQPNMQIHVIAAVLVAMVFTALPCPPATAAAVLLCVGSVLAFELANTALEQLVDLLHPERSDIVKHIKDMAAAAVLMVSVMAGLVLLSVLIDSGDWIAANVERIRFQLVWGLPWTMGVGVLLLQRRWSFGARLLVAVVLLSVWVWSLRFTESWPFSLMEGLLVAAALGVRSTRG